MSKKVFVTTAILAGLLFVGSLFAKMQLVHYGHPIIGLVVMGLGIIIAVVLNIVLIRTKKDAGRTTTEESS
jgi:Na+-driven multidrug efflux pump